MSSGKDSQNKGQAGEYLVAAELCRRGFVATTFTRNMPDFDILAMNKNNVSIPIQVKSIARNDWQFSAEKFLEISFLNDTQKVINTKNIPNPNLICVFVKLISLGKDEFYIFRKKDLQKIIHENYVNYLKKHNGRRPQTPKSTHTAVHVKTLSKYRDNWSLLSSD